MNVGQALILVSAAGVTIQSPLFFKVEIVVGVKEGIIPPLTPTII